MSSVRPSLSRPVNRRWAIALVAYLSLIIGIAVIAYQNALPTHILNRIPCYDLIGHFFLMGMAAYLTHRTLQRRRIFLFSISLPMGPTVIGLMTVLDEMMQSFSPVRTMSWLDFLANVAGILTFYAIDRHLHERKQPVTSEG